jgi:hypothetical protein
MTVSYDCGGLFKLISYDAIIYGGGCYSKAPRLLSELIALKPLEDVPQALQNLAGMHERLRCHRLWHHLKQAQSFSMAIYQCGCVKESFWRRACA